MSKGNVNNKGNKKNNFPYQQSVLLLLDQVAKSASTAGLATEGTSLSILNAIFANNQDFEFLLVRDEAVGNGDPVVKQVTDYTAGGAPVITYENVDGTPYVPAPNPVPVYVYLDPTAVMQLVLGELITLNAGGQLALDATLLATNLLLTGASKTPSLVTAVADGTTAAGVKGMAMWVRGTGGTIDGEAVPNGARFSWGASDNNDTVAGIDYTVPTGGVGEIIITYLT